MLLSGLWHWARGRGLNDRTVQNIASCVPGGTSDLRGGRPPVLLRAVALDFLAGVGGSELSAGALRFELDAF